VRRCLLIVAGTLLAAGCATGSRAAPEPQITQPTEEYAPVDATFDALDAELSQKQVSVADPLEPVNRFMFGVNDALFVWVIKPVGQAYIDVVPTFARVGIRNFFHNLTTPARLANCLLQGKGDAAGTEASRFAINTLGGLAGFGDPARDQWGLKPAEEDLGQTLAIYGFGDGCYLVWPLMGPSTLRDSVGDLGDEFLNPVRYVDPQALSIGLSATNAVNSTSFRLGDYESLRTATVDPYVAMRDAYIQYRSGQIHDDGAAPPTQTNPNR
jgi:phospholipid-binding lipoprotein MlaA